MLALGKRKGIHLESQRGGGRNHQRAINIHRRGDAADPAELRSDRRTERVLLGEEAGPHQSLDSVARRPLRERPGEECGLKCSPVGRPDPLRSAAFARVVDI